MNTLQINEKENIVFNNENLDGIIEILSPMLIDNKNEDTYWNERGVDLMKSLLSILVPLRDKEELFSPNETLVKKLDLNLIAQWIEANELNNLFFKIKQQSNDYNYIELKYLEKYLQFNGFNVKEKSNIPEEAIRQHGFNMFQWSFLQKKSKTKS